MKKRMITYLLILVMTISSVSFAFATAGGTVIFDKEFMETLSEEQKDRENINVQDMVYDNGKIYVLMDSEIYTYDIQTQKAELLVKYLNLEEGEGRWFSSFEEAEEKLGEEAEKILTNLFIWEEKLFAINGLNGKVMLINQETGEITQEETTLTVAKKEEDDFQETIFEGVFDDDLFYTVASYGNMGYPEKNLFSINLKNNEKKEYSTKFIHRLVDYKEGKLLAVVYDEENAYNQETQKMEDITLQVFSPKEDRLEEVVSQIPNNGLGIAYKKSEDAIYYSVSSKIYKLLPGKEGEVVGYIDDAYGDKGQKAWITEEDTYILFNGWSLGVTLKNVDPKNVPTTTLSISGGGYNEMVKKAFYEKHPKVPIVNIDWNTENYASGQAMTQAIQSGETMTDIFYISPGYFDFETIMKKEYAYPLTENQNIADKIARLYPYLQNAVTYNGQIYAVPEDALPFPSLSYIIEVWEKVGLTQEDIPKSYMEFLDLAARWEQDLQHDYEEFAFFSGSNKLTKEELIYTIIEAYMEYYQKQGELLNFDTDLFRKMMEKIEQMNLPSSNQSAQNASVAVMGGEEEYKEGLFSRGGSSLISQRSNNYEKPLVLPLDEGMDIAQSVHVTIAFINPRSENKELAMDYLEEVMNNYRDENKIVMYADENEPIKNENYEKELAYIEEMVKEMEEQLESGPEEEKAMVKEGLRYLKKELENKDDMYWAVSAEGIEVFNGYVPSLFVSKGNILYSSDEESNLSTLLENYINGAMNLSQFISEANRRVQMVALENE